MKLFMLKMSQEIPCSFGFETMKEIVSLLPLEWLPAMSGGSQKFPSVLQQEDPSAWAKALGVLWLHGNRKDLKYEWELLESNAVASRSCS